MSQGQISDDGMWRWDRQRWVPNQAPLKKSRRGRNIGSRGALAALVVLIVIVVAVSCGGGSNSGSSATPSPGCKQPCAQTGGVTLSVTNFNTNATSQYPSTVKPGMKLVTVTTEVTNQSSNSAASVNAIDFKLQDSAGTQHNTTFGQVSGCTNSPVSVAKGGTSGVQCFTFEVPQSQTTGLTLIWRKLGSRQVEVKLNSGEARR